MDLNEWHIDVAQEVSNWLQLPSEFVVYQDW